MATRRRSPLLRILLWISTFGGGALTGMGLFLLGQVQLLGFLRDELSRKGFLARTIGELTFPWRGLDQKLALAVGDIPQEYIDHSRATGLCFVVLGLGGLGLLIPYLLRRGTRN